LVFYRDSYEHFLCLWFLLVSKIRFPVIFHVFYNLHLTSNILKFYFLQRTSPVFLFIKKSATHLPSFPFYGKFLCYFYDASVFLTAKGGGLFSTRVGRKWRTPDSTYCVFRSCALQRLQCAVSTDLLEQVLRI